MLLLLLALKATVLLAAAAVCARLARRSTASVRHAIWIAALAGVLLLPAGTALIPRWELFKVPEAAARVAGPPVPGFTLTVVAGGPHIDWADVLFALWAVGAALVLARIAAGVWQARRMVARSKTAEWAGESLGRCLDELQYKGLVQVVESTETGMPFNWGSTVVLPPSLRQAPQSRLRAILLHEIAHVERRDSHTQWLAHMAAALYWFHPLAWLAVARARREREHACDDRVLELSRKPSAYAAELMEVARAAARGNQPLAAPAMAERCELEERVMAILDGEKKRGRLSRLSASLILTASVAVVLPLAATQAIGSGTGAVGGIIHDPSGAPVKNARIIVTAPGGGGSATTVTDAAGNWRVAQLESGKYAVEVQAPGFRLLREPVQVKDAAETRRDLTLAIGSVREEMTVRLAPPAPASAPEPAKGKEVTPAPSPAAAPPPPQAPDGGVSPVRLLRQVKPVYPESAKGEKATGQVVLRGVISVDGSVIGLTTLSASRPDFEESARTAVQRWKFEPAKLNGVPVEVVTDITINFQPE